MNRIFNSTFKGLSYNFSVAKKKQMELTIRTPYKTILADFSDFTRIITKTQSSALIVQNRTPPALHILPPGFIKVKLNQENKETTGDYLHTGGWMIVHADNSCEINVMDLAERKECRPDMIDKGQFKESDSVAGKYIAKSRRATSKTFMRRLAL